MKEISEFGTGPHRFLLLGKVLSVVILLCCGLFGGEEKPDRRYFNVPAGEAINTLKLAVKQAQVEIIMSAEVVKNVRTRKIKGTFTPIEAFNQMLRDTQLSVVQHEDSGVFTIKKTVEKRSSFPTQGNTRKAFRVPID